LRFCNGPTYLGPILQKASTAISGVSETENTNLRGSMADLLLLILLGLAALLMFGQKQEVILPFDEFSLSEMITFKLKISFR